MNKFIVFNPTMKGFSRIFIVAMFFISVLQVAHADTKSNKKSLSKTKHTEKKVQEAIKNALASLEAGRLTECPLYFFPKDKTDIGVQTLIKVESALKEVIFSERLTLTKDAHRTLGQVGTIINFNLIADVLEPVNFKKVKNETSTQLNIKFDFNDDLDCVKTSGYTKDLFTPPEKDCRGRISVNSETYIQSKKENRLDQVVEYVGNLKLVRLNNKLVFSAFYDGYTADSELMSVGLSCLDAVEVKKAPTPNLAKKQPVIAPTPEKKEVKFSSLKEVLDKVQSKFTVKNEVTDCRSLYTDIFGMIQYPEMESLGKAEISNGIAAKKNLAFNKDLLTAKKGDSYGSLKCGYDGKTMIAQWMHWDPSSQILFDQAATNGSNLKCARYFDLKNGLFSLGVYSEAVADFVSELEWEKTDGPDMGERLVKNADISKDHCVGHMSYRYLDVPLASDRYFIDPTVDEIATGKSLRYGYQNVRDQGFIEVNSMFGLYFYHAGKKQNAYGIVPPYEVGSEKALSGWGIVVY